MPKNAMNGANMNPGIIVNNTCNFSAASTSPEESIAANKLLGNKVKIDVSGNPRLPAAVIPAVITNKPKRLVLNIPFNGLFCFDNLCYRRLEI